VIALTQIEVRKPFFFKLGDAVFGTVYLEQ
jgi:hypothetical protein